MLNFYAVITLLYSANLSLGIFREYFLTSKQESFFITRLDLQPAILGKQYFITY